MNRIKLKADVAKSEGGTSYIGLMIFVDDVSLIELVRRHEVDFVIREGHHNLAGSYAWIPRSPDSIHSLLETRAENDKVMLLQCPCGEPGCWPFMASIRIGAETVVWDSFEQPHRGQDSLAGHWDYACLGPFEFNRKSYEAEILSLK